MATQNAFGLRWLGVTKSGAPGYLNRYGKGSSDAQPIYMNDLLMKSAISVTDPEGGNPQPGCKAATVGTPGTGLWLGTSLNYGAASTATMHAVVDDPGALFVVQSDSSAAETIASVVGKNANLNVAAAGPVSLGSSTTKQSGMTLASSSITTTASKDVRITQFSPDNIFVNPDNAAYPILEIQIVLHQFAGQSAGV